VIVARYARLAVLVILITKQSTATMIDAEGPAAERLVDGAIGARPSTTGNRG